MKIGPVTKGCFALEHLTTNRPFVLKPRFARFISAIERRSFVPTQTLMPFPQATHVASDTPAAGSTSTPVSHIDGFDYAHFMHTQPHLGVSAVGHSGWKVGDSCVPLIDSEPPHATVPLHATVVPSIFAAEANYVVDCAQCAVRNTVFMDSCTMNKVDAETTSAEISVGTADVLYQVAVELYRTGRQADKPHKITKGGCPLGRKNAEAYGGIMGKITKAFANMRRADLVKDSPCAEKKAGGAKKGAKRPRAPTPPPSSYCAGDESD